MITDLSNKITHKKELITIITVNVTNKSEKNDVKKREGKKVKIYIKKGIILITIAQSNFF